MLIIVKYSSRSYLVRTLTNTKNINTNMYISKLQTIVYFFSLSWTSISAGMSFAGTAQKKEFPMTDF